MESEPGRNGPDGCLRGMWAVGRSLSSAMFLCFVCVFFRQMPKDGISTKNGPHTHRQAAPFHSMLWEKGSLSCRCNKGVGGAKIEVK